MDRDTSDILGQKTMPRSNGRPRAASSFSMTQAVFASMFIVAVIVVGRRLWRRILIWRERSLRLATRRRHGIPDSDHRPFNVAYNDAMKKSRDDENRKLARPRPSFRPQVPVLLQPESAQEQQGLRNRTGTPQLGSPSIVTPVPGRYSSGSYGPSSYAQARNTQDAFVGDFPQTNDDSKDGLTRHGGYMNIDDSDNDGRKRGFDEEQLEGHESKKSRVEGGDMMDGDEDAEFEERAPKRGSKRGIHDEDNEHVDTKKSRGKRARKVSLEKPSQGHDMDVDVDEEEADEITELKSTTRGKKRDRAEAGSTFGGDDGDSADEPETDGNATIRRRRKRRTVAKRKSEASHARGKKRDRVGDGYLSEGGSEGDSAEKQSMHKKGKRSSHGVLRERAAESDISMEDSSTKGKVREIGDEWESNGVKYKIGPNGQRLRQALVKKARQKFVMPKDSQHPDRNVNLQVCIETWLTEEEYQEAKAQHNLAWQDEPNTTKQVQKLSLEISPENTPTPQGSLTGKNLLWSSTSTPTGSPGPQTPPPEATRPRAYRHSLGAASLVINPFTESQIPTAKRIASNARSIGFSSSIIGSPGLSDSTNGSPRKALSKWEKQELEARAMMKIREANKKKEQEEEARRQAERERAEHLANEQQRLNRERLEKERAEKEKADKEKEKAELDKKAKEAATSMPPPFGPAPSSSSAAPTPSSGPSSFFSVPTSGPAPASLFSVPPKAPSATSSQPSSSNGFNFANPAQAPSNSSAPPVPSASQPAAAPGGFSFNNPSTANSASASTPAPAPAPAAAPRFNFGPPKKDGDNANAASGGSSLLSRLGPQVSETPPKASSHPTSNAFSFVKPPVSSNSNSTGATQNPFGQPAHSNTSSAPANGATSSSTPSSGGSMLKFNFSAPNKTTTAPAPAANGVGSSLSGALGSDAQKAAAGSTTAPAPAPTSGGSLFNFKTPTMPASATNNATGTASTTPATSSSSSSAAPSGGPKFNFGTSSFGTQGSTTSTTTNAQVKEPAKSGFGAPSTFGNAGSNTSSAFGNTGSNTSSAFGGNSNNNTTSSAFGGGNNNTTSAFGSNNNTSSAFGSNNNNASSAFGSNNNNASSAFGSNNNASSAFGGARSNTSSTFGNTNTTSAFGNTNTSSTFGNAAGSGPSPFGATAAQTSSIPGGGAAASANSNAKPAESSAPKPFSFGGTSSTTPSSTSTPSNAANKPSFSFGSNTQTPTTSGAASTTPASTPASGGGGFSFNFGEKTAAPSMTTTTPQQPSLFGGAATSGQSAFGNLSNTGGTSNVFGGGAFGAPAQPK